MRIEPDRALRVIQPLAARLGLSEVKTAAGMNRVINANMAAGVRAVTVNRGVDPRTVPLIVAGGAGPVHAATIALELDIPVVIIPGLASVFCAVGLLLSDLKYDYVRSFFGPLDTLDSGKWMRVTNEMVQQGRVALSRNNLPIERVRVRTTARMRYVGQYREIDVEVQPEEATGDRIQIARRFHELHAKLYGHSVPDQPVEVVDLAVTCHGEGDRIELARTFLDGEGPDAPLVGTRPVYLPDADAMRETPVYRGSKLSTADRISGPAIVELPNTSVFVPTEFDLGCDRVGSFILCRKDARKDLRERLGLL
jgi:N-methylhydantoinase A